MPQVGFPVTMAFQLLRNPMPSSGHHLKTQSCTCSSLPYMQGKQCAFFFSIQCYYTKGLCASSCMLGCLWSMSITRHIPLTLKVINAWPRTHYVDQDDHHELMSSSASQCFLRHATQLPLFPNPLWKIMLSLSLPPSLLPFAE